MLDSTEPDVIEAGRRFADRTGLDLIYTISY